MNFLSFAALVVLLCTTTVWTCPDGCQCSAGRMSCHFLSEIERDQLINELRTGPMSQCEHLEITSTSNFSINQLPALSNLQTLIIDQCPTNDEFIPARQKFPNVTMLKFTNSGLNKISKMLASFSALEELDLSYNNVNELAIESLHLGKVRKMTVKHNKITSISGHVLRFMPTLKELDLSDNHILRLVTGDFSSLFALRVLNLANNRIRTIECDTSVPLPQIEELDLSGNLLSELPGDEIHNMEALVKLNLSFNPLTIASEASLRFANLQVLDLSYCNLAVVEAGAFSFLPHLHTLYLNNNPQLLFTSPYAFRNSSAIFSLDLRNTGFKRIPMSVMSQVSRLYIAKTSLDCACALENLNDYGTANVMDWEQATCATKSGAIHKLSELNKPLLSSKDECVDRLILPFYDQQNGTIGDKFRIYCASDDAYANVTWTLPEGTVKSASSPELTNGSKKLDYFTTSLFDPTLATKRQNRTHPTTEYFGFDILLAGDRGTYECNAKSGGRSISRKIFVRVLEPEIQLNASHVGSNSVHLTWNKNLHVRAVDRIALQVVAESGTEFKRQVQLSLYNMYCSYNLINLSPEKEYFICLQWITTDDNTIIYQSCISQKTSEVKGFLSSFSIELVFAITIVAFAFCFFCCGNCIQRFSFSESAKKESKMNQSVSGQSMLSSSASSSADATMYENFQLQTSPSFQMA